GRGAQGGQKGALAGEAGGGGGGGVAGAGGALHGGGPSGGGVVAGEDDAAGVRGLGGGAGGLDAGDGGEGGPLLFHRAGGEERCAAGLADARCGKAGAEVFEDAGGDAVLGEVHPVVGGADDGVDGAALVVLAEEPLRRAVHEDGVGQGEDGTIEEEVDAEDGAVGEVV